MLAIQTGLRDFANKYPSRSCNGWLLLLEGKGNEK
jgi:hypothetical protein